MIFNELYLPSSHNPTQSKYYYVPKVTMLRKG